MAPLRDPLSVRPLRMWIAMISCRRGAGPADWRKKFPHRCYFYPGRDCPGWEYGGTCARIDKPITPPEPPPEPICKYPGP